MKFYEMDDAANERAAREQAERLRATTPAFEGLENAELTRINATWTIKKGKVQKVAPLPEQKQLPPPEIPARIREALNVEGLSPHARLILIFIRALNMPPRLCTIPTLAKMTSISRVEVGRALTQLYEFNFIKRPYNTIRQVRIRLDEDEEV